MGLLVSSGAAHPPHGYQVNGGNLLAFTALRLNIAGAAFIDRKHFVPAVGADNRSGAHGRGSSHSLQHFVHSLGWALVHRHPSFIRRYSTDRGSGIWAVF